MCSGGGAGGGGVSLRPSGALLFVLVPTAEERFSLKNEGLAAPRRAAPLPRPLPTTRRELKSA